MRTAKKEGTVREVISAGSSSLRRETHSHPPSRSIQKPPVSNKQLIENAVSPRLFPPLRSPRAAKEFGPSYPNIMGHENMPNIMPQAKPTGPFHAEPADESSRRTREPETRRVSQEQLAAEVKGIYAGLVMIEARCIDVNNKLMAPAQSDPGSLPTLNSQQWQTLIALHRALLDQHSDFFFASYHPSASPAVRGLASKYSMPARMWRYGIYSFLELLRQRLPASLDHMLAFIHLAFSTMALLYEAVPAFEDIWIECLGDLGRYRMAVEDDDARDRDLWAGVARHWYLKASDNAPGTGRLYHHLAILARPRALLQLFYYSKSLCVAVPFPVARDSIITLFNPILNDVSGGQYRLPPFDMAVVKAHELLFTNKNMEKFQSAVIDFLDLLDDSIGELTCDFMEKGLCIAISNIIAMLGYGSQDNTLARAIDKTSQGASEMAVIIDEKATKSFLDAEHLTNKVLRIVLKRKGDANILPFIHITLVFMRFMSRHPRAMRHLEANFPWRLLTEMLNPFLASYPALSRVEDAAFPLPIKDHNRPLAEDFALRGLTWAEDYFPETWFAEDERDDEERSLEVPSMIDARKERILWLACSICRAGSWISYDQGRRQFSTAFIDTPPLDSRISIFQWLVLYPLAKLTSPLCAIAGMFARFRAWISCQTNQI